jgi:hypothetical protein
MGIGNFRHEPSDGHDHKSQRSIVPQAPDQVVNMVDIRMLASQYFSARADSPQFEVRVHNEGHFSDLAKSASSYSTGTERRIVSSQLGGIRLGYGFPRW